MSCDSTECILQQILVATLGDGSDYEFLILCDDNGAFLRRLATDPVGDVTAVDTLLDGVTPYATVGVVDNCMFGIEGQTITTLVDEGDGTYTYTSEDGTITVIDTTASDVVTTLVDELDGTYTYTSEDATVTVVDTTAFGPPETITTLVDNLDNTYTYTSEDATVTIIDAVGVITTLVDNGDGTFTHTSEDGTVTVVSTTAFDTPETVTTLVDELDGTYTYTSEDATVTVIDTTTGGETVTTLVDNGDGTVTYTSEDATVTIFDTTEFDVISTLVDELDGTYTYTDEDGTVTVIDTTAFGPPETVTTLIDELDGTYTYTSEDATVTVIDTTGGSDTHLFTVGGLTNTALVSHTDDFGFSVAGDGAKSLIVDAGTDDNRIDVTATGATVKGNSATESSTLSASDSGTALVQGSVEVELDSTSGVYSLTTEPTVDSDTAGTFLKRQAGGELRTVNDARVNTLGAAGDPVDGTTTAWYVGQLYTNQTDDSLWYASAKSTDPDAAATGSTWVASAAISVGGVNENYANADLTADASYTHNWGDFDQHEIFDGTGGADRRYVVGGQATQMNESFTGASWVIDDAALSNTWTMLINQLNHGIINPLANTGSNVSHLEVKHYYTDNITTQTQEYILDSDGHNLTFGPLSDLRLDGDPGSLGQVVSSNGLDLPPTWEDGGGGGGGDYATADLTADMSHTHDWTTFTQTETFTTGTFNQNWNNGGITHVNVSNHLGQTKTLVSGTQNAQWKQLVGQDEHFIDHALAKSGSVKDFSKNRQYFTYKISGEVMQYNLDQNGHQMIFGATAALKLGTDAGVEGGVVKSHGSALPPTWGTVETPATSATHIVEAAIQDGTVQYVTSGTDTNYTVNDSLPVGGKVVFQQKGAGQIIVLPGAFTVNAVGGADRSSAQFGVMTLRKEAAGVYALSGDIA